jgi:hypothetical protein
MEGESVKWFSRFTQFRLMKSWERSINAVFIEEKSKDPRKPEKTRENADKEWYRKAREWQWQERAESWDAHQREERDRLIALEEEEILKAEYSLKHNRIKDLNKLAILLKEEVEDESKRWVEDVKAVGKEPYYVKQFNDAIIREYRATLDDIAKEKGERVKLTKSEVSGPDGGPISVAGAIPIDTKDMTNEEIAIMKKVAMDVKKRQEEQEKQLADGNTNAK